MKKLLSIALLMICIISFAKAQNGITNGVITNQDRTVPKIKPNSTITLIPSFRNGGAAALYEPATFANKKKTKIPVNLIIKNNGVAKSKPCKVIFYVHFQAPRTFSEVEHGVAEGAFNDAEISEPLPLQALAQGEELVIKHAFVFRKFPNLAPGKKVRLTAQIFYTIPDEETDTRNNTSRVFEVELVTEN
ncbi:hypothetical protein [Pedobacter sp. Leaf132]|uniref:hypothetical protein n=1 Tax=Pedobacter sp. Leaf132 TaxID=2876557 RepID=UPI001E353727|nr:hypothetical protein [Pedobacter sp. Leaf132]